MQLVQSPIRLNPMPLVMLFTSNILSASNLRCVGFSCSRRVVFEFFLILSLKRRIILRRFSILRNLSNDPSSLTLGFMGVGALWTWMLRSGWWRRLSSKISINLKFEAKYVWLSRLTELSDASLYSAIIGDIYDRYPNNLLFCKTFYTADFNNIKCWLDWFLVDRHPAISTNSNITLDLLDEDSHKIYLSFNVASPS